MENIITVSGVANDCNGMPLQTGTALIYSGRYFTYTTVTNGSYSTLINHCDGVSSLTVVITDDNTTAVALPVETPVSGNMLTVPAITLACGLSLNVFDGIYQVTGTFSDASNAAYTINYPRQFYLITTGPSNVIVSQIINGEIIPGTVFSNGVSTLLYSSFGLQASFNVASNAITEIHNYYGDPANPPTTLGDPSVGSGSPDYLSGGGTIRSAILDPSGLNNYNPVSKVIKIKYFMYQSTFTTGPRCSFDETWTYIGPR
jgi:hypothetical protein